MEKKCISTDDLEEEYLFRNPQTPNSEMSKEIIKKLMKQKEIQTECFEKTNEQRKKERKFVEQRFYSISYLIFGHQEFTGEFFFDTFPDELDRIQIWGIWWKKHKEDIQKLCSCSC